MQKKRLAYIIPSLGVGGAEVALLSAIPELNKHFDFKLICLSSYNASFTVSLSENERKNIVVFKKFPFNYLRALLYTLKFNPDIIITSLWKAAPIGIFTQFFIKRIVYKEFIHNSLYFHFLDRFFTKWALKSADGVFCDSASAKKFVEEQGFKKPVEIISFLRFQSPEQWLPKQQIALKALFIGRFHEQKRIDKLVLLVKKLVDSGLDFHVDLYGRDDGTMDVVKVLIKEHQLEENIFLKGEVASDKVQDLFADYDFYMQLSDVEGMAMSVVEAMQFGIVPIVTPVGEIKNYTRDMYNAIHISQQADWAEECAKKIQDVIQNISRYNALSKNAYATFLGQPEYKDSLVLKINNM